MEKNYLGEKRNYIACCLCGKAEWGHGHNVEPIPNKFWKFNFAKMDGQGEGRCCKECNDKYVIPYRIGLIGKHREENKIAV